MSRLTISCPSCGFSRQIPYGQVPDGPRRVTCPQCKESFVYSKPEQPPAPDEMPETQAAPVQASAPQDIPPAAAEPAKIPPPISGPSPRPTAAGLTDIGELFQQSWNIYQRRFVTLIGLGLLGVVALIVPIFLSVGAASLISAGAGTSAFLISIGILAGLVCGTWFLGGFLCAVTDEGLKLKGALQRGKGVILPLAWVSFLCGFIVFGGYLLLIIPGIIFSVWFFATQFLLVEENVRGMGALLKSREYVRGQWFNVAIRLLLIWAVSGIVGAIPLVGPILSLAFLPYLFIFNYLVYRDLRRFKGDVPYSCGCGDTLLWPGVALVGLVLVPALVISVAGFSLFGVLSQLPSFTKGKAMHGQQTLQVLPLQEEPQNPTFPAPPAEGGLPESAPSSAADTATTFSQDDEYPESVSVFIYAVNYTGEVRVNDTVIQKLEGEPDMQYNYNLNGKGFRYGQNRVEVKFAELPNRPSTMLEIHMKISRSLPNSESMVLGEWRFSDKETGTKTFDLEIPK